ncbi:hypothetical protein MOX02_61790 [Methylobacterium oxalidis]|uniref:Uncharacterized protein n=1 Tax=Methylobacterium oxalidis TaxID=944322 RepID=A0A512JDV9_9HYPH|nr:hypothetical protein MOX02_61790 [Methylobacterium oxalidis]GLS64605.1 hypothetical protein GCM10007888_29860 [Methylobacterium oxalidis]
MQQNGSGRLLKFATRSDLAARELSRNAADLESHGFEEAAATLRGDVRSLRVDAIRYRALAGGLIYMSLARSSQ